MPDTSDQTPFQSALQRLDVETISRTLYGCSIRTIYCCRDGTRTPPLWLQSLILAVLYPRLLEQDEKNKLRTAQSAE